MKDFKNRPSMCFPGWFIIKSVPLCPLVLKFPLFLLQKRKEVIKPIKVVPLMKKVVIILFQTPTSFFSHRYREKKIFKYVYSNIFYEREWKKRNCL